MSVIDPKSSLLDAFQMPKLPLALLFDCDGTITDPDFLPKIIKETMVEMMGECGQNFAPDRFDQIFQTHKGGGVTLYFFKYVETLDSAAAAIVMNRFSADEAYERVVQNYVARIDDILSGKSDDKFDIREGVREVMAWARSKGIKIAVVTNAHEEIARANLKAAGLFEKDRDVPEGMTLEPVMIDLLVHKGFYKDIRKPHRYPFKLACGLLGVNPAFTIGFEDSANGHRAMRKALMGLRVHFAEEVDVKYPVSFPHQDGEIKVPPHVIAGLYDFSVDFMEQNVIPAFLKRMENPFEFGVRVRQKHGLPLAHGDDAIVKAMESQSPSFEHGL